MLHCAHCVALRCAAACCALLVWAGVQRALQAARGSAKPLLPTLLTAVGELFTATQQPACLDVLSTISEVFGEVKNAPELAAAQKQSFEGGFAAAGVCCIPPAVSTAILCISTAVNAFVCLRLVHNARFLLRLVWSSAMHNSRCAFMSALSW